MARRRRDEDEDDLPRKKSVRREDDELDDDLDENLDEDLEAAEPTRNNAYTGLLAMSFIALCAAAFFFYQDASELKSSPIPQPNLSVPAVGEEKQALPLGKQP